MRFFSFLEFLRIFTRCSFPPRLTPDKISTICIFLLTPYVKQESTSIQFVGAKQYINSIPNNKFMDYVVYSTSTNLNMENITMYQDCKLSKQTKILAAQIEVVNVLKYMISLQFFKESDVCFISMLNKEDINLQGVI